MFAVAGVIALIASGLLLFNTGSGPFSIDVPVVIFAGALLGGLSMFAASKVMKARRGPVSTGWEELLGHRARCACRSIRSARSSSRARSGGPAPSERGGHSGGGR